MINSFKNVDLNQKSNKQNNFSKIRQQRYFKTRRPSSEE